MKKFELGRVRVTIGALEAMKKLGVDSIELLERHQGGDWLKTKDDDIKADRYALENKGGIFSSHPIKGYRYGYSNCRCSTWEVDMVRFWIIIDACGSRTMILLPSEY